MNNTTDNQTHWEDNAFIKGPSLFSSTNHGESSTTLQEHRRSQDNQSKLADNRTVNGEPLKPLSESQPLLVIEEPPLFNAGLDKGLQSVIKKESSEGYRKKPIDDNFHPRKGKSKQNTLSNTTSTSQPSTNQTTSLDNYQKNKQLEFFSFSFSYENDENFDELEDIPLNPIPFVNQEFQKIANTFHGLGKAGDYKNPEYENLSRQMKELRYWQAVDRNLIKLDLHRLTSRQFVVIIWYFKTIREKMKQKKNYPQEIEIVCGQGHHNDDQISRIGPALDKLLNQKKIITTPSENPGTRFIDTKQESFKQYVMSLA